MVGKQSDYERESTRKKRMAKLQALKPKPEGNDRWQPGMVVLVRRHHHRLGHTRYKVVASSNNGVYLRHYRSPNETPTYVRFDEAEILESGEVHVV